MQDIANDGERAVALRGKPFLKRLRVELEIGQKLATVQVCRSLQLGPMPRAGESLEPVEINGDALQPTIG